MGSATDCWCLDLALVLILVTLVSFSMAHTIVLLSPDSPTLGGLCGCTMSESDDDDDDDDVPDPATAATSIAMTST